MIQHIYDGIISLMDTYLLYYFLSLFLHIRKTTNIYKLSIFILLMFIHIFSSNYINSTLPIKIILVIFYDVTFCCVIFEDKWRKYFLFTGLFYFLMIIYESASLAILNLVIPNFDAYYELETYSFQSFAIVMIMRVIMLTVIIFIKIFKSRPVRQKQWRGLLLMPILTFVFVWLIYPYYWAMDDQQINTLLMALAVFLVIQNLFVFAYIAAMQSSTERYFAIKEAYDRQKQYSSTISTIQKAVRKMAHDIRHHFIYLRSALDQEDIPKAKAYLNQLDENLENIIPLNVTGHYDVDALLHAKASIADKLNIHIRVEGTLPPELMISPIDLSALLGNSVDNAIESASRIDGEKEITIAFYYNASRLNYTISNPYNGLLQRKPDGYFVSQKGSGLGFEIMDEVVKKYGGALLTENDNDNFKLTVMLQNPQS